MEDAETGSSLQYQLYIPENYDDSQLYPMIQFIPDSSVVGKGTDAVLTQGLGGLIWATATGQEKHSAFVVVPVFTETIVDDNEAAFAADLSHQDALGNTVDVRLNMYNPMYYLSAAYEGYQTAEPAVYWRIRSGINQGDTALCTELNLALAADAYSDET